MLKALASLLRFRSSLFHYLCRRCPQRLWIIRTGVTGGWEAADAVAGNQPLSSGLAAFSIHSLPLSHLSSLLGSFDTGATVVGAVSVFIQLFLWERYGG